MMVNDLQDKLYSIHSFLNKRLSSADHTAVRNELREIINRINAFPAWHDRPTKPGLWVGEDGFACILESVPDDWTQGRVFGPIPLDSKGA